MTPAKRRKRRAEVLGLKVCVHPGCEVPTLSSADLCTEHRFWSQVDKTDTCWLWTGAKDRGGYAVFFEKRFGLGHRYSYTKIVGSIPDGLQLDHLCRVRHCVNPAHLEPVTPAENTRRGLAAVKKGRTHGRASTYNGGCRCELCREAGRNRLRAKRVRQGALALPVRCSGWAIKVGAPCARTTSHPSGECIYHRGTNNSEAVA